MAWTYTKTDWKNGDMFNYTHYNRIKGNIDYLVSNFSAFTFDYSYALPTKTVNDYLTYEEHNAMTEYAKRLLDSYVWEDKDMAYRLGAIAGSPVWDAYELNSIEESLQAAYERLLDIQGGVVSLRTHKHSDLAVLTHKQLSRYVHGTLHKGYIPEIDTGSPWDYEVENVDYDGATLVENSGINPFSSSDISRDWEIHVSGHTTYDTEATTTIGVIGRYDSGSGNKYYIEIGLRQSGVYVFRRGYLTGTHNQVFTANSQDTDISIVKSGNSIEIRCEGVLLTTLTVSNTTGSTYQHLQVGGWDGSQGTYYFNGHLNYYRFKWNS